MDSFRGRQLVGDTVEALAFPSQGFVSQKMLMELEAATPNIVQSLSD